MRPEHASYTVLSTTRATAKMHEFRVDEADFIDLPRDPAMLFSTAVGILGDVAAAIADGLDDAQDVGGIRFDLRPRSWNPETDIKKSLQFASLFFDSYLNAHLNDTVAPDFSLLCAATYYLGGNVGSATVIAREAPSPAPALGSGLGIAIHAILRNDHADLEPGSQPSGLARTMLGALDAYRRYEGEAGAVIEAAKHLREACYRFGAARELLFGDVIAALIALKLKNSARNLLPTFSNLDSNAWRPAVVKPRFPVELWPAQQRIAAAGLLSGASAVIQMPTSAGKTRATELMIRSAFLAQRATLAVIVAPYRSLCHDIRGDLAKAFAGEAIGIDEATDSYQFDIAVEQLAAQPTILIVTPEKFLYILRRAPDLIPTIGLVIYDEGHQFEGMQRGPTYELLLTSLRMTLRPETQVVLISAVIGNAAQIGEWLIGPGAPVVTGEGLASTTRSVAFASWQDTRGRLEYVKPADPDEGEFFVPRLLQQLELAGRLGERTVRLFPKKTDGGDIALYLGLHVVPNGSVAIFCGRKDSAAKIGRRAVEVFDREAPIDRPTALSDAHEIECMTRLLTAHLGANSDAAKAASLGILIHHADTPPGIRLSIEHAMKENLARFVICTSTLAQGVNFPIKYLIVTSTQQGAERIKIRDFQNLMGRAGRAGMHTESSVIFSVPEIYDKRDSARIAGRRKWLSAKELLDPRNAEPCGSGLLEIFEPYEQKDQAIVQEIEPHWLDLAFADRQRIADIVAEALQRQPNISAAKFTEFLEGRARAVQNITAFLANYMDFGDEELGEQVTVLAANTLAYHLADDEKRHRLIAVFQLVADSIRNNADGNLQLIIRKSPLPPAMVAQLSAWLAANIANLAAAILLDGLDDIVLDLLLQNSQSPKLRKLSNQNVLPQILRAWISGEAYSRILDILNETETQIGNGKPKIEDAVAICENGFSYDVAMVAASLADLAEPLDESVQDALTWLQKRIKYGLPAPAQVAFFEAGFADRVVASALAERWPDASGRSDIRRICRDEPGAVNALLRAFPSYFKTIAAELSL